MSVRACNEPGCPDLTEHRSGKCDTHRRAQYREAEKRRPDFRQRGYNAEYERSKKIVRREENVCSICGGAVDKGLSGKHPFGPVVHHLVDRQDGGDNSRENLRLAHQRCNAQEARRRDAERRKGGRA